MTPRRAFWFILNGPPMMAIAFLGLIASLVEWSWLDQKCEAWFLSINRTQP